MVTMVMGDQGLGFSIGRCREASTDGWIDAVNPRVQSPVQTALRSTSLVRFGRLKIVMYFAHVKRMVVPAGDLGKKEEAQGEDRSKRSRKRRSFGRDKEDVVTRGEIVAWT